MVSTPTNAVEPKPQPPSSSSSSPGPIWRRRLAYVAAQAALALGVYLLGYFGFSFVLFVLAPLAAAAVARNRREERRRKVSL